MDATMITTGSRKRNSAKHLFQKNDFIAEFRPFAIFMTIVRLKTTACI